MLYVIQSFYETEELDFPLIYISDRKLKGHKYVIRVFSLFPRTKTVLGFL